MDSLSDKQFEDLAALAQRAWGLQLTEGKRALVTSRMAKHVARSRFTSVAAYVEHLRNDPQKEDLLEFFDLLSTNKTSFFRENEHFDYLRDVTYQEICRGPARELRFWSAACSTGAEPYSLAMHALEHLPEDRVTQLRILATDLSTTVLHHAKRAEYTKDQLSGLSTERRRRYLEPADGGRSQIHDSVRSLVSIHRLNLMDTWPMRGPFDVIMVRNVMIYFDRPTRENLIQRMCHLLAPHGVLIVGSAETLSGLNTPVVSQRPSIYRPMRAAA